MKVEIVSPKTYTYGSLVLGGILRDRGHSVSITRDLRSEGEVTLLSLFSTSQLLDYRIRDFVKGLKTVYVGGPVGLCPQIVLGELKPDAVVMGEGEDIVSELVEEGPSRNIPGVAFLKGGKVVKTDPKPAEKKPDPREKAKRGQDHEDARLALLLSMLSATERDTLRDRLIDDLRSDGEAVPLADLLAEQEQHHRQGGA